VNWRSFQAVKKADLVHINYIVSLSLEFEVRLLGKFYYKVTWLLSETMMSLTLESEFVMSHAWFHFDDTTAINSFLSIIVNKGVSLKVNFLLATIEELLKSAFNRHKKVRGNIRGNASLFLNDFKCTDLISLTYLKQL
jgi:hypothetical protein